MLVAATVVVVSGVLVVVELLVEVVVVVSGTVEVVVVVVLVVEASVVVVGVPVRPYDQVYSAPGSPLRQARQSAQVGQYPASKCAMGWCICQLPSLPTQVHTLWVSCA